MKLRTWTTGARGRGQGQGRVPLHRSRLGRELSQLLPAALQLPSLPEEGALLLLQLHQKASDVLALQLKGHGELLGLTGHLGGQGWTDGRDGQSDGTGGTNILNKPVIQQYCTLY